MNLSRDIHPLTDFKRNTSEFIAQLKQADEPVVQDADSYQKLLDIADMVAVIEAEQKSLKEMKAGLGRPADDVFADI